MAQWQKTMKAYYTSYFDHWFSQQLLLLLLADKSQTSPAFKSSTDKVQLTLFSTPPYLRIKFQPLVFL